MAESDDHSDRDRDPETPVPPKPAAKKAPARKSPAKKAPAKPVAAKKAVKKAPAKKAPAKKAAAALQPALEAAPAPAALTAGNPARDTAAQAKSTVQQAADTGLPPHHGAASRVGIPLSVGFAAVGLLTLVLRRFWRD